MEYKYKLIKAFPDDKARMIELMQDEDIETQEEFINYVLDLAEMMRDGKLDRRYI